MNIIRKIKINKIHPVKFTDDESNIIEIVEKIILSLFGGTTPYYYHNKYQNYIYYSNSEEGVVMYKEKDGNFIHIYKPFLYNLIKKDNINHSEITIEDIGEIIAYYFNKHLIKKTIEVNFYPINYLDDIMKNGWHISIML